MAWNHHHDISLQLCSLDGVWQGALTCLSVGGLCWALGCPPWRSHLHGWLTGCGRWLCSQPALLFGGLTASPCGLSSGPGWVSCSTQAGDARTSWSIGSKLAQRDLHSILWSEQVSGLARFGAMTQDMPPSRHGSQWWFELRDYHTKTAKFYFIVVLLLSRNPHSISFITFDRAL